MVGLGNHALKGTRHNMGMIALDYIISKQNGSWIRRNDLDGFIFETNSIKYFKPTQFMNASGKSVKRALEHYKLNASNLLVVHDDLDRKLGKLSIKNGGSASGHNGIKSIISSLNSHQFDRIRIGIGRPADRTLVSDFVLTKFTDEELKIMHSTVCPNFDIILQEYTGRKGI